MSKACDVDNMASLKTKKFKLTSKNEMETPGRAVEIAALLPEHFRSCTVPHRKMGMQVVKRFHDTENFQVGQSKCTPCVSPNGNTIAAGSSSGVVLLVDMKTSTIHSKLAVHSAPVTSVAWNPHAEDWAVCTASVDKAGDVIFWTSTASRVNSW